MVTTMLMLLMVAINKVSLLLYLSLRFATSSVACCGALSLCFALCIHTSCQKEREDRAHLFVQFIVSIFYFFITCAGVASRQKFLYMRASCCISLM